MDQVQSAQLLLADIGMPGEDGYSLIRRVRASAARPRRARAGRSRSPPTRASAIGELAFAAGFDRHLTKPVQHAELLQVILALLQETTTPPSAENTGLPRP